MGEIRVLHVDDEPDFVEMASTFLERADDRLRVDTATSAASGLDHLADEAVDCVISDYDMPDKNGIELLESVREDRPDMPFVLFTGKGSEEIASDAISAGVTDYLQKGSGTDQYTLLANRVVNAVEKHAAETEVRTTKRRFETLLEHSADYIHVLDADGTAEYHSPSVERVLGYTPDELDGTNPFERLHPDDREDALRTFEYCVEEPGREVTVDMRTRHKNGSWRWLEVKSRNLLDDPTVGGVVGNVRDITERKETEAAVDWHKAVIRNMGEGVYVFDADYEFQFVNYRAEGLEEISEDNWTGRQLSYLADIDVLTPEEVERIRDGADRLIAGDADRASIEIEPAFPESSETVELRLTLLGADTADDLVLGTTRDITRRKKRESELRRRNERLNEFASVVSHDLRNPLNVAQGRLELLQDDCESEHLDDTVDAVDRSLSLVDDLLALSRQGDDIGDVAPVDLAAVVEECCQHTEMEGVSVRVEAEGMIRADRSRLKQLLSNLFRNAMDHGGDDVRVVVGSTERGFYVADDGPGIPTEKREAVFEPGYSMSDGGTGYGLATVRQIARAHGWESTISESELGGARFDFEVSDAVDGERTR